MVVTQPALIVIATLVALVGFVTASPVFVLPRDDAKASTEYLGRVTDPWHKPVFDQIISFGDSFSDTGNGAWAISNNTWPADRNYVGHRFSNGPVWIENTAKLLHLPLQSFAIGGATTDKALVRGYTGPNSTIAVPSVNEQVDAFLRSSPKGLSRTLFVLEGGGNDAFFGLPNVTASQSVTALVRAAKKLEAKGAQYVLVPTLPPLAPHYPFAAQTPSYVEPLAEFSAQFREAVRLAVGKVKSRAEVDLFATYSRVLANPKQFGFDPKKIDENCLKGVYSGGKVTVCANPRSHIWWDEYHPTRDMHFVSGYAAVQALQRVGWV
ncbi:hypothetical protein OIV83_000785 [Microbotryomycetes sp. JL201]|nr:hypothetical protein OIV83_000785 [Microbotryomycetes sp. JL201]